MFIDHAKIFIKAGDGGNGCTSFYTEKYIANGGPDGGDGGKGGDIVFVVDPNMSSLADFRFAKLYKAEDGGNGSGKFCHGKCAPDLIIKVPRGRLYATRKRAESSPICSTKMHALWLFAAE